VGSECTARDTENKRQYRNQRNFKFFHFDFVLN
jgi:hypothetical protein